MEVIIIKKYLVYCHTSPSGKKYVGITCQSVENRWKNGKGYLEYGKGKPQFNKKFINAIKKYGWDSFKHEIIEDNIPDLKTANERERFWISFYDSFNNGYNATIGGDGSESHIVTKETRTKISKANKGMVAWNKGIACTPEMRKHLSETNKGKPSYTRTLEHKSKMSKAQKGKHNISEETRQRLSESHKGQPGYWTGKQRSRELKEKLGTPVEMYDLKTLKTIKLFYSMKEAADWLVQNGYTKGKNPQSSISAVCLSQKENDTVQKTYLGFGWRYLEK